MGRRILVVEDNEDKRDMFTTCLDMCGAAVFEACGDTSPRPGDPVAASDSIRANLTTASGLAVVTATMPLTSISSSHASIG